MGVDLCGVADLYSLNDDTHLLEKHYNDTLVGPLPKFARQFKDRSAIYHADKIVDPLLILQGEKDTVVPKKQCNFLSLSFFLIT